MLHTVVCVVMILHSVPGTCALILEYQCVLQVRVYPWYSFYFAAMAKHKHIQWPEVGVKKVKVHRLIDSLDKVGGILDNLSHSSTSSFNMLPQNQSSHTNHIHINIFSCIKHIMCNFASLSDHVLQQIRFMHTPHQFLLLSSTPSKEIAFRKAKQEHGSIFAFQ